MRWAQRAVPASRVVYVDNDPIVLLHAQALLRSDPQGTTDYLQADLREPGLILNRAAAVLDLGQPVAVMLLGVLHLISRPLHVRQTGIPELPRLLDHEPRPVFGPGDEFSRPDWSQG